MGSIRSIGTSDATSTQPHPQSQNSSAPAKSPKVQSSRRSFRPLIYGATFLFLGLTAGQYIRYVTVPPPLPLPNSPEDLVLLHHLEDAAEKLPIIQELRSHPHEWSEESAYGDLPQVARSHSLTTEAMSGSRGLAVQNVFYNSDEQRIIGIVFFGGALAGWPGVTHGGTIAIILQEYLEKVATMSCKTRLNSATKLPPGAGGSLESMKLKYLRPTLANRFFVIRAEVNQAVGARARTGVISVKATLEEVNNGAICAEVAASCRLPV